MAALKQLNRPEEIAAKRGLPIEDVAPAAMLRARAAGSEARAGGHVMSKPEDHSGQVARSVASSTSVTPCARWGCKRIGQSVVREDRPEVRGMIRTVRHLVTVEEVD